MTLFEKQILFTKLLSNLLQFATTNNTYLVKIGEILRAPIQYEVNAMSIDGRKELADFIKEEWPLLSDAIYNTKGRGIRRTLHRSGLAVDLMLFTKDAAVNTITYCSSTQDYKWLGDYWVTLDPLCRWGGEFGDGGHFSIEHNGVK
jgi:hypothetical protein